MLTHFSKIFLFTKNFRKNQSLLSFCLAVTVRPTKRTGRCLPGQHTGCSEREETQMKQLTNYQRVSQYLVKVFKAINESYFRSELEIPTITIQSSTGNYGHVSVQKVWHNRERQTRELNISADYLDRPIENVVATLIHEASHLWALQNHIQDTSNRGVYTTTRNLKP